MSGSWGTVSCLTMCILSLSQSQKKDWLLPLEKPIGDTREWLIFGRVGEGIFGRADLPPLPWTKNTCWPVPNILSPNPVRAGLAAKPQDWQWSSVHHHLRGTVDPLVKDERTGRPCGDSLFVDQLENLLGRKLKPQKPGPKVKN